MQLRDEQVNGIFCMQRQISCSKYAKVAPALAVDLCDSVGSCERKRRSVCSVKAFFLGAASAVYTPNPWVPCVPVCLQLSVLCADCCLFCPCVNLFSLYLSTINLTTLSYSTSLPVSASVNWTRHLGFQANPHQANISLEWVSLWPFGPAN